MLSSEIYWAVADEVGIQEVDSAVLEEEIPEVVLAVLVEAALAAAGRAAAGKRQKIFSIIKKWLPKKKPLFYCCKNQSIQYFRIFLHFYALRIFQRIPAANYVAEVVDALPF